MIMDGVVFSILLYTERVLLGRVHEAPRVKLVLVEEEVAVLQDDIVATAGILVELSA